MSYSALDWALPKVIMDVNAKSCLVVLAYHHNGDTGLCCPSISKIADKMGVKSLNTVRKAIKTLEEMKLLKLERVFGEHGEITSTRYTLNLQSNDYLPIPKKKEVVHDVKEVHNVKEAHEINDGGSPHEGGVVHDVREGASCGEGGVVHHVNPNKEIEQGNEQGKVTRNVVPAPASADLFPDATEMIDEKKPKKSRAKAKTQCPFSPDEQIPDDYLAYAKEKHPSIDALKEFRKFVNSAYANGRKYSDWKAAWRTWTANAEDWKPKTTYTPRNNAPLRFDDAYYGDGSF